MSDIKVKRNGIIVPQLYMPQLTEGNLSQYRKYMPLRYWELHQVWHEPTVKITVNIIQ